jgi:hypothetical protein
MPDSRTVRVTCRHAGEEEIAGPIGIGICTVNRSKIRKVWLNGNPADYLTAEHHCALNIFVDVARMEAGAAVELVAEF